MVPRKTSHHALSELLLRPPRLIEDGGSSQPRAADEVAGRVELLGGAPSELSTDDLRRANDAGRARARASRDAHPPKRVSQRAHLLVARGVDELCLGDRFAAA